MRISRFIVNSLRFNFKKIIILTMAVALSTAVLSGALFLGDSVKLTIIQLGKEKIGNSRYIVYSDDSNFMLPDLNKTEEGRALVPLLKLPAPVLITQSGITLDHFNAYAVDGRFFANYKMEKGIAAVGKGQVVINESLAQQLGLSAGDILQFRCAYFSQLSPSFSFYADNQDFFMREFKVSAVLPNRGPGRFSTSVNQAAGSLALFNLLEFQQTFSLAGKTNLCLVPHTIKEQRLRSIVSSAWQLEDKALRLRNFKENWKLLESGQLFLSPVFLGVLRQALQESYAVFSYFINMAKSDGRQSPFHFVAALEKKFLKDQYGISLNDNQALISHWLAEDLQSGPGAALDLDFYFTASDQQLQKSKATLVVQEELPQDFFNDLKDLMPDFPGLADKKSCSEWDPGIPVDLDLVREKDEVFWDKYQYSPKILLGYQKALDLWATSQARATGLLLPKTVSHSDLEKILSENLSLEERGIFIDDYLAQVSKAGRNSISFAELFLGLGFLLIIAALLLLVFILQVFYSPRKGEIFILKANGFSAKKILRLFLVEALFFTAAGVLVGIFLGFLYNILLIKGLTGIWYESARLDTVLIGFSMSSLLIGSSSALLINFTASWLIISRIIKKIINPHRKNSKKSGKDSLGFFIISAVIIVLSFLVLFLLYYFKVIGSMLVFFFIAGVLMLIFFPVMAVILIRLLFSKDKRTFSVFVFILTSMRYQLLRNISIIVIASLAVFMIISIGANKTIVNDANSKQGSGGYEISITTALPLNPQQGNWAHSWRIPQSQVLALRIKQGDEASCLNLNQIRRPRISSINPEILTREKRFKIVREVQPGSGWAVLSQLKKGNVIPAMADAGVLQWSLGLDLGDSLEIRAENGEVYQLLFMASLANSIFQGSVLISEENFLRLYPSSKGYKRFLIDLPKNRDLRQTMAQLQRVLRQSGPLVRSSLNVLKEYYSVQNSYVSIFFQLGLMAMVFAGAGISVLVLRKIQEERKDIIIRRAIGFPEKKQFIMMFLENFIILLYGVLAGSLSALIALLPIFREKKSLLLDYPFLAFLVILTASAFFLAFFIFRGLQSLKKELPGMTEP